MTTSRVRVPSSLASAFALPLAGALLAGALLAAGCGREAASPSDPLARAVSPVTAARAERRLFDGAPPVIPHAWSGDCIQCHSKEGTRIENLGIAPAAPHEPLVSPGPWARCSQCHVRREADGVFVATTFSPHRQDLRHGRRAHELAPPIVPHVVVGRENCRACHTGLSARPEIVCDHPERGRCRQCHLVPQTNDVFQAALR